MTEQRNNAGRVFQNLDKRNKNSPHYLGRAIIDGVEYYVSVWHNPPRHVDQGKATQNLRFRKVADAEEGRRIASRVADRAAGIRPSEDDDDIPI